MKIFGVGIISIVVLLLLGYISGVRWPTIIPLPAAIK